MELFINTDIRASELVNLDIRDLPPKHGKNCIWVRDGKGKVSRSVDIPESLIKRLARFVKLHRKGARANSPLLVSEQGGRMIYRSVYSKKKRIGQQAGMGQGQRCQTG